MFLSYGGCAIAVVMAVPATLFGAVAKATDWSQTEWGHTPNDKEATLVLPLCLQVNEDSQFYHSNLIRLFSPPPLLFLLVSDASVGGLLRPWRRLGGRHVLHRLVHALGKFHARQELLLYSPPSQGLRSRGRRGHERPHRHQRHSCHHAGNRLSECLQPLVSR